MTDFKRENELFKEYIGTLEKQNQARNIERNTLFKEIDRMSAEIDRLNELISRSNAKVHAKTTNVDKELKNLKESFDARVKQLQTERVKNSLLASQLKEKDIQIQILVQQKQSLLRQIDSLRQRQYEYQTNNERISVLDGQVKDYRIKFAQIGSIQQNIELSKSKIEYLEEYNQQLQRNLERVQFELRQANSKVDLLENQNEQLRLKNRTSLELSNLVNAKANLEATVNRLNSKIQWLENNRGNDQQTQALQIRIKELEGELVRAKIAIQQFQQKQQSFKSIEASLYIKESEFNALEQTIINFKENKKYLEATLREKEDFIMKLQTQIQNLKILESKQDHYHRENYQLKEIKMHMEHQIESFAKNNKDYQAQINRFLLKQQAYTSEIALLRGEREKLLRDVDEHSNALDEAQRQLRQVRSKVLDYSIVQHQPYPKNVSQRDNRNNDEELRSMISGLQYEIEVLKASQFQSQSQIIQEGSYNNYDHYNMGLKSQVARQSRSPTNIPPSRLVPNERDRNSYNKNKWENLQRKIGLLRSENETLKKTLFD